MSALNKEFVRLGFAAQLPLQAMNATLEAIEDGSVTIAFPVADQLTTAGTGIVMGGVLALVADVAAGLSILTRLSPPRPVTTVSMTSTQIAPAKGERVICVGRLDKIGRGLAVTGADVFVEANGQRTLCARLSAAFAVS
jgi:uncharacterized protein (TIGR00369 family)